MPPDLLNSCRISYAATDALDEAAIEAACAILSDSEKRRAERFAFPRHRRDFVAAHALLRRALSEWHPVVDPRDWTFAAARGGKPELAPPHEATGLSFNLAHTDGLVACAIARGADVGIDLEAIDRRADALGLARRYFSPAERADLERQSAERLGGRFIEIWTMKEAFVKATGAGVTLALDAFSFAIADDVSIRFDPPSGEDAAAWRFALLAPFDRYRMAVAVRSTPPNGFAITAVERSLIL